MQFVVIDRNKNHAIIAKELACDKKSRVHHREPGRVEPSTGLWVAREKIPRGIHLSSELEIVLQWVCKIIRIDEIVSGVEWWIDVDHLDASKIGLIE